MKLGEINVGKTYLTQTGHKLKVIRINSGFVDYRSFSTFYNSWRSDGINKARLDRFTAWIVEEVN